MFDELECIKNADLRNFSTMKTGGVVKSIVFPKTEEELVKIMKIIKKNKLFSYILGNGSNILFSDNFLDAVLISLKNFNSIEKLDDERVLVGAGTNLFALNHKLAQLNLSGLEFSYGIPASIGGFLVMNGGCFGHEIGQFVEEVKIFYDGKIKILKKKDLDFSYRNSNLKGKIIINCILKLKKGNFLQIKKNMEEFYKLKREKQPCEFPSLGSVFKQIQKGNETIYPAKVIDELGLKGLKVGGAEVSQKHSGFVINKENATSRDVYDLVCLLEQHMKKQNIFPEKEIILLGDF